MSDEEREGYFAAKCGKCSTTNPYPRDSEKFWDWSKGWDDYHADVADKYYSQKYGF